MYKIDAYNLANPEYSYALCYVDSEKGALSIISDYGNWSYLWGTQSLPKGKTFKEFLKGISHPAYIAQKLFGGNCWEVNREATEKKLKGEILEARRNLRLSQENARYLWEELDVTEDYEGVANELGIGDYEPEQAETCEYLKVRDHLLPDLLNALAKETVIAEAP